MFVRTSVKTPKNQKGLVLLVLAIIIVLAFASYSLSGLSINQIKADQAKRTRQALKDAKEALIAYAVNFPEITAANRGPGYLLCPDTDNDGVGQTGCNGPSTIGRLPWVTLGIGDLRDGANERLWYAVSENFDFTASPFTGALLRKIINTATRGNITVRNNNNNIIYDGTTIDGIVAIIIAPGVALTRDDGVVQDRSIATGDPNAAINFLDIHVASGEDNASFQHTTLDGFIKGVILNGSGDVVVNDVIEVITYHDIMDRAHKRVASEISNTLNRYYNACDAYPEASAFDPMKASFDSAGFAPPVGSELRQGHLPLGIAQPVDWGGVCDVGPPVVLAPVPPLWLAAERWDETTYYTFAYQNAPPANGLTCGNGANPPCMTVNNTTPPINNSQALIVFVGRELPAQDRNTVPVLASDFLEGENAIDNGIFDADETEDFVRVITP